MIITLQINENSGIAKTIWLLHAKNKIKRYLFQIKQRAIAMNNKFIFPAVVLLASPVVSLTSAFGKLSTVEGRMKRISVRSNGSQILIQKPGSTAYPTGCLPAAIIIFATMA